MSAVQVRIGQHTVGFGKPVFVIAEVGVNHNGDEHLARRLIDVAATAGADAVKFQTFRAELLATATAPKAVYQLQTTGAAESQLEMLRRLELSADSHRRLRDHCRARNVLFLSSAFDERSTDLLDELGVPAFKLGSGELTNQPLLKHVGRKGKPVILSTGMSGLEEVRAAVAWLRGAGCIDMILLHCVSAYPADASEVNLRAMQTLAAEFGTPVGYSDHTLGNEIAVAAVALGACVVEKHLTLDRALSGPDHRASAEPAQFAELVRAIRTVESALGSGRKETTAGELDTARVARKSLVAARELAAGSVLTSDAIAIRRPGTGLPPSMLPTVIGRRLVTPLAAGDVIRAEHLAETSE